MLIRIHPENGIALYDQVVRQVKFAVAEGSLRAGEMIPSVRELARRLAINPNTVARAYRQLQDDGVLQTMRGMGLRVTDDAAAKCRGERQELIRERLRGVILEAVQSGLQRTEIERLVAEQIEAIQTSEGVTDES